MRQEVAGTVPETDGGPTLTERVAAARSVLADNAERLAEVAERLRTTRSSLASGRSRREQLHESAYARLRAQLETMPVIEQAKGILIAQTGCTPRGGLRPAPPGVPAGQRPRQRAGGQHRGPGRDQGAGASRTAAALTGFRTRACAVRRP